MIARVGMVVAVGHDGYIGDGHTLPWSIPEEMAIFKKLTLNQTLLMGRNTALSLGRALPKRRNLVLTRDTANPPPFAGMENVSCLAAALEKTETDWLFIIGGGQVYDRYIDHSVVTDVFISVVDYEIPYDLDPARAVRFNHLHSLVACWHLQEQQLHRPDDNASFRHMHFTRLKD